MAKKRVNVMLSEEVLRDLREMVPARKRSEFVEEVLRDNLDRERFEKVLKRLERGEGLKAEDYPHWATQEAIEQWRKELWASSQERIERMAREEEDARVPAR